MKILIVSATPFEVLPTTGYLQKNFKKIEDNVFKSQELTVTVLITGVGMFLTTFQLSRHIVKNKYDIVLNVGIAGALNDKLKIGDVVNVVTDRFGDIGVEEKDGSFSDLFDLGLIDLYQFPFTKGVLSNNTSSNFAFLPAVSGITVNKVHGNETSITLFTNKYKDEVNKSSVDVESMEGAAVSYICLAEDQKFLQIRSISNYVEPRNKDNWDIELAITNLNSVIIDLIGTFLK